MRRSLHAPFITVFAVASVAHSATLRVPGDYATIQPAVDAAQPGDTVLVAPGTYTGAGNTNIEVVDKDLVVRSVAGPEVTIIDCGNVEGVRGFYLRGQTRAGRLEGFTVRRAQHEWGGIAVYLSSPTVRQCICEENTALQYGAGGISVTHYSDALIEDCVVRRNLLLGGFYVGTYSTATFLRCQVRENLDGGGRVFDYGSATLEDCTIIGNAGSEFGGGLMIWYGGIAATNCTVTENYASRGGGGIYLSWLGRLELTGCTVARNSSGDWGGGISMPAPTNEPCVIDRSIISGNCAPHGSDFYLGGAANISCSALAPSGLELGNLGELIYADDPVTSDPLFCAPGVCPGLMPVPTGDYQLRSDSPCLPEINPCGQLIGALSVGCWVPPAGACCVSLDCQILASSECDELGGIYKGDGVPCEPATCDQTPVLETSWGKIKAQFRSGE